MHNLRTATYGAIFAITFGLSLLGWRTPATAQDAAAGTLPPGVTIPPGGAPLFLPHITLNQAPAPERLFSSVPTAGGSIGRPAENSADVNLALRGYASVVAYLGLVNYGGDTDANAPQIAGMFDPVRLPAFTATYQVYDWDWNCGSPDGCRSTPITVPYGVTLLALATIPGEALAIPRRGPDIYAGGYKAMVLYADERRITFGYTREDSPAYGYVIHLEEFAVAPELIALYRELNAAGRHRLPALQNGEMIGIADRLDVKLAIRDTGMFMDPRACKDWWVDYMSACTVHYTIRPTPLPPLVPAQSPASP